MIPNEKNIKRYFSLKELAIIFLAVVLSVVAGTTVFYNLKREVIINDNGNQILIKTMKTTVGEVLEQNGITLGEYDEISLPLDAELQKTKINEIYIERAVPVNIFVDGKAIQVMTCEDTVGDVLKSNSIELSELDRIEDNVSLEDSITANMNIRITRVREELITEQIPIPYSEITTENNNMDKGTSRVVREGKDGIRERIYKVIYEDGKEVLRELVDDVIALAPVNKIIEYGTVLNFKTSRGETVRYKKVLNMEATAYTASYNDTGKNPGDAGFGITYTGKKVKEGIIAVDPSVIPLGTRVYVECLGNTPDYGFAVAEDIGSAIKGNVIDLYFDNQEEVAKWGRRSVRVYILK